MDAEGLPEDCARCKLLDREERVVCHGRDDNHGDLHPRWIAELAGSEIPAIENRHHEVQDDQVGLPLVKHDEPVVPVGCLPGLVALVGEELRDQFPDRGVILNDEDSLGSVHARQDSAPEGAVAIARSAHRCHEAVIARRGVWNPSVGEA